MNLHLDPDLVSFRDTVRAFLGEHLSDELRRGQRLCASLYPEPECSVPWAKALNRQGWLVPLWPMAWGGSGWTPLQRFIFETECALSGAPLVNPMGPRLLGPVILRFGTEEQKRRFLPSILAGEVYWCQGFSEPGAGSDLASLKTRAVRDGEVYVVNGSKIWTTHAHHADWIFALVRTGTEGKPQQGISFLLIDLRSPGVTVRPIDTIGGDHDLNEVFFDDVRVSVANRVGEENQGWECAKYLLEFERGAGVFSPRLRAQLKRVADALVGLRGPALPATLQPWLASRFGEVVADLDSFEMMELTMLGTLVAGEPPGVMASVLKLRASRLKQAIGELGVDVLGGEALRWRDDLQALPYDEEVVGVLMPEYANSRANTIFGGAAEVQLGLIARCL
jgi:acyl-CoA dehydrogenase